MVVLTSLWPGIPTARANPGLRWDTSLAGRRAKPRQFGLQHVPIEEQNGAQGLVLGAGADFPVNFQVGEETRDLLAPQIT